MLPNNLTGRNNFKKAQNFNGKKSRSTNQIKKWQSAEMKSLKFTIILKFLEFTISAALTQALSLYIIKI